MGPEVMIAMMAAGTLISAGSKLQQGEAASQDALMQQQVANSQGVAADYQADQMRVQAGQERAASQRSAYEERKAARLLQSRAKAVAAASGGGATDPTALDIYAGIGSEGEYRALSALYLGEDRARGLESGAALKNYEGSLYRYSGDRYARAADNAVKASKTAAVETLIGKTTSIYDATTRKGDLKPQKTLISGGESMYSKYGAGGPLASDVLHDPSGWGPY